MSERIYWELTAAIWCLVLLPTAACFYLTGERRRAGIIVLFGLIGGVPSMLGHLL